jgi:catechol 2,3-dioxygenase
VNVSTHGDTLAPRLPATLAVGPVHLVVSDLQRSVAFYNEVVGLTTRLREPGRASLGVGGSELLVLLEEPGARPSTNTAGLFHFALRVPTREALAAWLQHAAEDGVRLTGLSDHFVSEAIYLDDPDRHGIEIYWDRPRELWEGQVARRLTSTPLDTTDLMRELADHTSAYGQLPTGTDMGHIHLRVGSIPTATAFYGAVLGFDIMATMPEAAFLSVGGYHHHVGLNTWQSRGAKAAPVGFARIEHATINLPERGAVADAAARVEAAGHEVEEIEQGLRVCDPFGTALVLAVDPALERRS